MELFTFFNPGSPFVFIELQPAAFNSPASAVLEVIDGAGNTCTPAIQIGSFTPGDNNNTFPPIGINIPIPVPPNPGGDPSLTFQCEDFAPFDFDQITPNAFVGSPVIPITSDPAILPQHTFGGVGLRLLCCQFSDLDGVASPPFCGPVNIDSAIDIPAPTFLTGRPKPAKIDLLWTSVDVAEEYIVSRAVAGGAAVPIATTESTLYVDFDVEPALVYTYSVQAVAGASISPPSKFFEVFIPAIRGDGKRIKK